MTQWADRMEALKRWHAQQEAAHTPPLYPKPEVPARDATPEEIPAVVKRLLGKVRAAGWEVRVTYAKGWEPHARTGLPHRLVETVAMRMVHRVLQKRVVAVWEYAPELSRPTWKASFALVCGPDEPLRRIAMGPALAQYLTNIDPLPELMGANT